ncbi:MAG: hypothetical protein GY755_13485 [Chloroflexi bacterium]|nr:hypothetical protein [Chloroflexota bacterium]
MAKGSNERKIIEMLSAKDDCASFEFSYNLVTKLRRCAADMNRCAIIDGKVQKGESAYSVTSSKLNKWIKVTRNF